MKKRITFESLLSRWLLGALLLASPLLAVTVQQQHTASLSAELDVTLTTYPARGDYLILWLAPDYGIHSRHAALAAELARQGIEVWQTDLTDALFLPRGSQSMRAIDGRVVADLIRHIHKATGKKIVLLSSSYGAIPVLKGAREWQLYVEDVAYLSGIILFSPNLYQSIPSLGVEAEYEPIVHASNLPIMVYQAEKHGNRWQFPQLVKALRNGGSQLYFEIMPGVTSLFYEEDSAAMTLAQLKKMPAKIKSLLPLLDKSPRPKMAARLESRPAVKGSGIDIQLKTFRGDPIPYLLALNDAAGQRYALTDYQGKVTVVNFWATWCPPCVEEIPSLNRLRKAMAGMPFRLISINYAEDAERIQAFMQKVQVDFPVLLDHDGKEAAKWKVIAFPSTFIIGPDGRIRYGVNAAIHWDAPDVIKALRELMQPH